ncbi:hypothetical protein MRX96_042315 [Rhipicephalus microplus]
MAVVSAGQYCEEDRANYSVFYDIGVEGEATLFPCLQCFAMPCQGNGEQLKTPITGTKMFCCRRCSHMALAGTPCNLQRNESAVVCHNGDICSVNKKVCVKECPLPPMP